MDVVSNYKLEFPQIMDNRDSAGREFETRINTWSDGKYDQLVDGEIYVGGTLWRKKIGVFVNF